MTQKNIPSQSGWLLDDIVGLDCYNYDLCVWNSPQLAFFLIKESCERRNFSIVTLTARGVRGDCLATVTTPRRGGTALLASHVAFILHTAACVAHSVSVARVGGRGQRAEVSSEVVRAMGRHQRQCRCHETCCKSYIISQLMLCGWNVCACVKSHRAEETVIPATENVGCKMQNAKRRSETWT